MTRNSIAVGWLAALVLAAPLAAGDWVNLFDGKTLDGWVQRGGKATYKVIDNAIVGTTVTGTPNSFLCTAKNYGDFELELEFIVDDRLNSGVQIRSNSYAAYRNGRVHGYQVEIDPSPRAWSAGIYDESRRGWLNSLKENEAARKAFKNGRWNKYRVLAVGDSIKTWINGVPAADLQDSMTASGFIGLQVHSAKVAGLEVRWRNIRLREIETEQKTIRVLIVDGQNNHNWKATTPVLRAILEDAGLFTVDVATSPKNIAEFKPKFSDYDVVVSNYNGKDWPEETRNAFEEFVNGGGGFVSVHAADNSFRSWKAYNLMIGVGGWGGRNETDGPELYWDGKKIVRNTEKGRGGSHGRQHPFAVELRDPLHPIVAGLPKVWMHAKDELYSNLRGPAQDLKVLATAFSAKNTGGTDRHEPMLMVTRFGEGRCFHTTLGHHVEAMECVGFAYTLQRGTEWCATGRVTLTEVPENFPNAEEVSVWKPKIKTADLESYDFGKSREALVAVEEKLRDASAAERAAIEKQLLAVATSKNASYGAKQYVIRILRRVGTAQSVPALASLLSDKELSHIARWALQYLPGAEATAALKDALGKVEGKLQIGIIGSLGARADRSIAQHLAAFLRPESPSFDHRQAAIHALRMLGGWESAAALLAAELPKGLHSLRDDALLACAESLAREADSDAALKLYSRLADDETRSALVRLAARRGLFVAGGAKVAPQVVALLSSESEAMRNGALRLLAQVKGSDVTRAIAELMPTQSTENQLALLGVLVARGDSAAYPAVAKAADSDQDDVRRAALAAIGTVGDVRAVGLLGKRLSGSDAEVAARSLSRLKGDSVDLAIAGLARHDDAATRAAAIDVLRTRGATGSVRVLFDAARDAEPQVRAAALRAVGDVGNEDHAAGLAKAAANASGAERDAAVGALRSLASRVRNKDHAANAVRSVLATSSNGARAALLGVLPALGSESALAAARDALRSSDQGVARAATTALGQWTSAAAADDLLAIVMSKTGDAEQKKTALSGYMRLVALPSDRPAVDTVRLLGTAMKLSDSIADKKRTLLQIGKHPCKEALALAESYKGVDGLDGIANEVAGKIRGILISNSIVATASHGGNDTKNAFDNNPGTRWSTGTAMRPGMWFAVDLGEERSITRIIMDTRNSSATTRAAAKSTARRTARAGASRSSPARLSARSRVSTFKSPCAHASSR